MFSNNFYNLIKKLEIVLKIAIIVNNKINTNFVIIHIIHY